MKPSFNVVFDDEVLTIFRHIAGVLGFRMSILDTEFRELAPLKHQPLCSYCRLIQNELGLLEECRRNDREKCSEAAQQGRAMRYRCHAGLMETVYPFFIEGECVGYFLVGQFRMRNETLGTSVMKREPEYRSILRREYGLLPEYDEEKLDSALEIIRFMTEYIVEHKLVSIRQRQLADRLLAIIGNGCTSVTVEDAAGELGRSVSTVNNALKTVTGKSFKQYQLTSRMNTAASLLSGNPDMTVAEAAAAVGMDDPFYFSRLFSRYMGKSPREYRKAEVNRSPEKYNHV